PSPQSRLSAGTKGDGRPGHTPPDKFLSLPRTILLLIVTAEVFVTRIPEKLAFSTVNPRITTCPSPELFCPSILMPFESPDASMMVLCLFWPTRASGLGKTTSSLYVPSATKMVSPGAAAATAAEMLVKHPRLPL